jgi:hypothetical protein
LIRFNLTKGRLAKPFENLGDGKPGGLLNALIQIDEAPSKLPCQESADGCLAGAHEAGKANHLRTGRRATQRRRLSHCFVRNAATKGQLIRSTIN